MRTIMGWRGLFLLLLLAGVGCNSNNKGKIEGTKWTNEAYNSKGTPIPAGVVQLHFDNDGKFKMQILFESLTGTYSLGFGDNVTLNLDKELEGRKKHTEKIIIDGDSLTMIDSDGTTVKFKRMKEEGNKAKQPDAPFGKGFEK